MRGNTLKGLRRILKGHLGILVDEGMNVSDDALYNQLLSSKQSVLATRWCWSFLLNKWDVVVPGGTRFMELPNQTIDGQNATINTTAEVLAYVKFSEIWQDVDYEITEEDYNILDPEKNDRQDPILKWRYNGSTGFEVWPLPASPNRMRFEGYMVPDPLVDDTDLVDLDDELIALYVAAERLAKAESADAQTKFREAELRMMELRGAVGKKEPIHLGYKYDRTKRLRRVVPITVARTQ